MYRQHLRKIQTDLTFALMNLKIYIYILYIIYLLLVIIFFADAIFTLL